MPLIKHDTSTPDLTPCPNTGLSSLFKPELEINVLPYFRRYVTCRNWRTLAPTKSDSLGKAYPKPALEVRVDTEEISQPALFSSAAEVVLAVFPICLKRGYCPQVRRSIRLRCTVDGGRGATNEGPLCHLGAKLRYLRCTIPESRHSTQSHDSPGRSCVVDTEFIVVSSANLLCISFSHDAVQSSGNSWRWVA